MSQSESTYVGGRGGTGKAEIENLAVTKYIDKASAYLMLACLKGEHIPEVLAAASNCSKYSNKKM